MSQKKVNTLDYIKLLSSFYPYSIIKKKINNNFKILISNNNKDQDKDKDNKNNNSSVEESKVKNNFNEY